MSLPCAARAAADEVYLKGGGRLSGVVVERTATMLTLETAPGRVGLPLARVERVVEGRSALGEYAERARRLGAQDLAGWLELARWAHTRGLLTPSRAAAERVVALAPDNADAQRLLGNVSFEGRWMSPDDARRARGLVLFEGEWITPAERADLLRARTQSALAETARAEAEARAREAEARARAAEADARRAESEERDAGESASGVPLWLGGGVILGPAGVPWPAHGCAGDCGARRDHGRRVDGRPGPGSRRDSEPQRRVGAGRTDRSGDGSARPRDGHGQDGGLLIRH